MARYRNNANPEYAEGMRQLRRSNAAGHHEDRRTRRNRSRNAQRTNAIKEQRS